jgi:hypothetical protein
MRLLNVPSIRSFSSFSSVEFVAQGEVTLPSSSSLAASSAGDDLPCHFSSLSRRLGDAAVLGMQEITVLLGGVEAATFDLSAVPRATDVDPDFAGGSGWGTR